MSAVVSPPVDVARRAPARPRVRSVQDDAPFQGILVPGLNGSDEHHWQSRWREHMPWLRPIELDDWRHPDLNLWLAALERALAPLAEPALLIGHSFGSLACAAYAAARPEKVAGLLLVAPACPAPLEIEDLAGPGDRQHHRPLDGAGGQPPPGPPLGRRLPQRRRPGPHQRRLRGGRMAAGAPGSALAADPAQRLTPGPPRGCMIPL